MTTDRDIESKITVTDDEASLIHSLLVKTFHIEEKSYPSICKFCGKPIVMYGINDNWRPMSMKHEGKLHKCRAGRKYYKKIYAEKE